MELDRIIAVRTDKAVYHDGDCAVKVFGSDFCKAKIFREAFYQTQLEATSLNVPPVEKICQIDDKWAIFSRYIRGKTLEQEMLETPEDMEKHIGKLVKVQLKIHEAILPDANFPNMKKELLQRLTCARLPEKTICRLKTVLETLPEECRLCHGDFNPSNIIYTAKGEAYILDWAQAFAWAIRRQTQQKLTSHCCWNIAKRLQIHISTVTAQKAVLEPLKSPNGFPLLPPAAQQKQIRSKCPCC